MGKPVSLDTELLLLLLLLLLGIKDVKSGGPKDDAGSKALAAFALALAAAAAC
jgi:hypothetical protein